MNKRTLKSFQAESTLDSKILFIACAALGREVRAMIQKHGWNADFQAIDARLHLYPQKIAPAVSDRLEQTQGQYARRIVVYGHCGAYDLDGILEEHGAVRPPGAHCFEMYGGDLYAQVIHEEPRSYILTDFLIQAWRKFVVRELKMDQQPELKDALFRQFKRLVYFSQEENEALLEQAQQVADWIGLPLVVKHVGYGDLERRLVDIVEGEQDSKSSAPTGA